MNASLLQLPRGLLTTGDPVTGNPFPTTDPRHDVWEEATRTAEEEGARLNSKLLREVPADDPAAFLKWYAHLTTGKFDIWAKRAIQVVWSDDAIRVFNQWLFNYAEGWLANIADCYRELTTLNDLLQYIRLCLIERMEHWKAEARRYVKDGTAHVTGFGNSDCTTPQGNSRTHPETDATGQEGPARAVDAVRAEALAANKGQAQVQEQTTRTMRGPKRDYKSAARVLEIVTATAKSARWGEQMDEICSELDDQDVPRPKTWRAKGYKSWFDCLASQPDLARKAIQNRLKTARRHTDLGV